MHSALSATQCFALSLFIPNFAQTHNCSDNQFKDLLTYLVIYLVTRYLQAGTEDAPVLDRPAPLRRFHDSGTGYKYPNLLTYLH